MRWWRLTSRHGTYKDSNPLGSFISFSCFAVYELGTKCKPLFWTFYSLHCHEKYVNMYCPVISKSTLWFKLRQNMYVSIFFRNMFTNFSDSKCNFYNYIICVYVYTKYVQYFFKFHVVDFLAVPQKQTR